MTVMIHLYISGERTKIHTELYTTEYFYFLQLSLRLFILQAGNFLYFGVRHRDIRGLLVPINKTFKYYICIVDTIMN